METTYDVEKYLRSRTCNLTAKEWLKNEQIKQLILKAHLSWNEDFIRSNQGSAKRSISENIDYYLKKPWLIDKQFNPPS